MSIAYNLIRASIVAAILATLPLAASANTLDANAATSVNVRSNGTVHVIGAEVTAVADGVVKAATEFGNQAINWVVNTTAETDVRVRGEGSAQVAALDNGDRINFTGSLVNAGSTTLTVVASRIRDWTTFFNLHRASGEVTSVNDAQTSFTLERGGKTLTVEAHASTTMTVGSLRGTETTFSAIDAGDRVRAVGVLDADTAVLTATHIVLAKESNDDREKRDANVQAFGRGGLRGLLNAFAHLRFGVNN